MLKICLKLLEKQQGPNTIIQRRIHCRRKDTRMKTGHGIRPAYGPSPHLRDRDQYGHSSEIDITLFTITYIVPKTGTVISAVCDEENGDTLTLTDGTQISDPDAVESYLGDDFDHYLNVCGAEQDRLAALKRDMESDEYDESSRETSQHLASMNAGRG